MSKPKWLTSKRKYFLSQLSLNYLSSLDGWKLDLLSGEFYNEQYETDIHRIISNWVADDRESNKYAWQAERKALHTLNEKRLPLRGRFNNVSSTIWHENQPLYYLENIGMNGLTLKPYARVKISSSFVHLYVDLGDNLRSMSKHKKRKVIRYHKPLPSQVNEIISRLITQAVKHYLNY
jgi:hypothetical protein